MSIASKDVRLVERNNLIIEYFSLAFLDLDLLLLIQKRCRGIETRWEFVLELFREPLEIDLICPLRKCSPCWEEQSINRVFHSHMPGSRVIVADITKRWRGWKPAGTLYLNYFENHLRKIKYVNFKNVRLVERNNLLIECFTLVFLDLELL